MSKKLFFILSLVSTLVLTGAGCVVFGPATPSVGPRGIYRSLDKAESWQPVNSVLTPAGVKSLAGVSVYKIFTDPTDPDTLYLAARGEGLFVTYDSGDSWQRVLPLSGKFIYALTIDPQNKCLVYVSDGPHIYKTKDCLRTWEMMYTEERPGQRVVALAVDYAKSPLVYAALLNGDILSSRDGGESWQSNIRFGFSVQAMVADPLAAGRLYVAGQRGTFRRSDNGGVSWIDLTPGLSAYSGSDNFYRLILHPSKRDVLFWVSKYGILRSNDAGQTWTDYKLITPPGSVNVYAFAINPKSDKELYYVGTILNEVNEVSAALSGSTPPPSGRSTLYKSVDGGATWITKKLPTNAIPVSLFIHPVQTSKLFLGFTDSP
ncbi:MAG: hypothetical protein EXS55_01700 [Candidatus Magasanikbacteria bacterium]|nr:hypothetical protein [Candidatus Magasanikbacteria bacterium]